MKMKAKTMNTKERLRAKLFLLSLLVTCSGCATAHVSLLGISDVEVVPQTASRAKNGNIAVQMHFVRRDLGIPAIHKDLGLRYALFDAKMAEGIVRSAISSHQYIRLNIQGFILVSNATDLCRTPQWYLYPPDWSIVNKHPALPAGSSIDSRSTVSFEKPTISSWAARLPQDIDGKPFFICIEMLPEEFTGGGQKTHRDWLEDYIFTGNERHACWGPIIRYPLYIPAVAFDIVTGPFQFLYIFYQFCDGMSALGGH